MLLVVVAEGPDKGRHFEFFDGQSLTLGRGGVEIALRDRSVAARQARLFSERGRWYIETQLLEPAVLRNGRRVRGRAVLASGDHVRVGESKLIISHIAQEQAERRMLLGDPPSAGGLDDGGSGGLLLRLAGRAAMAAIVVGVGLALWWQQPVLHRAAAPGPLERMVAVDEEADEAGDEASDAHGPWRVGWRWTPTSPEPGSESSAEAETAIATKEAQVGAAARDTTFVPLPAHLAQRLRPGVPLALRAPLLRREPVVTQPVLLNGAGAAEMGAWLAHPSVARAETRTVVARDRLTLTQRAYRLAFVTNQPVRIPIGRGDNGLSSAGRLIDPTPARAAGFEDWRAWYHFDQERERLRLRDLARQVRERQDELIRFPGNGMSSPD